MQQSRKKTITRQLLNDSIVTSVMFPLLLHNLLLPLLDNQILALDALVDVLDVVCEMVSPTVKHRVRNWEYTPVQVSKWVVAS